MEVSITAIVEVLNGVEDNLKKALHDSTHHSVSLSERECIGKALQDVQNAISELLRVS